MKSIRIIIVLLLGVLISACQIDGGKDKKNNENNSENTTETQNTQNDNDTPTDNNENDSNDNDTSDRSTNSSNERVIQLAENHEVQISDYPNGTFLENAIEIEASRVECSAPCGVHFKAIVNGNFDTERSFHELAYHWNFNDPDARFDNLPDNFIHGRSANHAQGPYSAHVFNDPGIYTVLLRVGQKNGKASNAVTTITVRDPDEVFSGANTLCVSLLNNFTDCPSGAQQLSSIQEAKDIGIRRGDRTAYRILFRAGEVFPIDAGFSVRDVGARYFGKYGSGANPKLDINMNSTIFWVLQAAEFTATEIDIEGDYNPVDASGTTYSASGFFIQETNNSTMYKINISGIGIGFYMAAQNRGAIIANSTVTDWYDYASFNSSTSKLSFIGNVFTQNPGAVSGSGAKDRDREPRWADHGPIRIATALEVVIAQNKMFSNTGWSSGGAGHQPNIRYNSNGTEGHSGVINKNELEGGFTVLSLSSQNGTTPVNLGNVLVERNLIVGTPNTLSLITTHYGNTTIRNNIGAMTVDSDGLIGRFRRMIILDQMDISSDDNKAAPRNVYGNTFLQLQQNDPVELEAFDVQSEDIDFRQFANLIYSPNTPNSSYTNDPGFDDDFKPAASFVENASNSQLLFDTFYGNVRPENSTAGAVEK